MKEIVILGGGAAGWMAALAIAARFPEKTVTVIDPEAMGPIGVGESVTGVVLSFVSEPIHDLSMGEFFRRCDVTFKAGIWYKNWQGIGTDYCAPIDSPPDYFQYHYPSYIEDFYAAVAADGARLTNVQFYSQLMRTCRTDHVRDPDGGVNSQRAAVSCHFDAIKFAGWLREKAKTRPNVRHIDDVAEGFDRDHESGLITAIRTRGGRMIDGEFFLDCSGFHRILLAKAYLPKWKSYADHIKVDSAIPCFQPHRAGEPLPTYTEVLAMPHGWMWQIPTQTRLGRGYLFSSKYIDPQTAIAQMRAVGVDPGDNPRILRFDSGRFEKGWIGNVCSIGLSGGFIEPLEASTIHGMYVQIKFLTELYLPFLTLNSMRLMADQYNELVNISYDDYLDFISFHYHTGRSDTDFWRDYQKPESITSANQFRMEKWKHAFPMREDFAGIYTQRAGHTTGLVLWAPVLCALGYFRVEHARRVLQLCLHLDRLRENTSAYIRIRDQKVPYGLPHAEAIAYFRALA